MYKLNYILGFLLIFGLMLLTSCSNDEITKVDSKNTSHSESEGDHDEKMEGKVILNSIQMEALDLKLDHLQKRVINSTVKTNGILVVSPKDKTDVVSYVGGNVKQIYVFEGDKVKKGQILAKLEHPDFINLQQEFITSYNKKEFLKKEYIRQSELYKNEISSGKKYQKIESDYKTAISKYQSLKIKLEMLNVNISRLEKGKIDKELLICSPMSGYISSVNLNLGSYIDAKTKMFSITNNDKIHADITIFEQDVPKVKIGQKIRMKLPGEKEEFFGEIFAIAKEYDKSGRTIKAHASINRNGKDLVIGTYISGEILLNNYNETAVPESSIVQDGGKNYIFIKDKISSSLHEGELAFSMLEVIVGKSQSGWTSISVVNGESEKIEVVINGAYYLLSDLQKSETEHSH
ncbi:MAG: efflux RND transporter periplasmic adaptor subunit [Marinifilaceae bacterium]|jgi:cobalt-zinc-cadmium efflux system membrane fusion protein|nr:efflux RND transporter periplasmic adaptor subunit [Marinifilaceae bacterium]